MRDLSPGTIASNRFTANTGSNTASPTRVRAQTGVWKKPHNDCDRYVNPIVPAKPPNSQLALGRRPLRNSALTPITNDIAPQTSAVRVRTSDEARSTVARIGHKTTKATKWWLAS